MAYELACGEYIVTAYAEPASGPGWSNTPLWLIVRGCDGALRLDCLQPEEQSAEIERLYALMTAAHGTLMKAVDRRVPSTVKR